MCQLCSGAQDTTVKQTNSNPCPKGSLHSSERTQTVNVGKNTDRGEIVGNAGEKNHAERGVRVDVGLERPEWSRKVSLSRRH